MNANELLTSTLSPDAATRENATKQLENLAEHSYPTYVLSLSAELLNESSPSHIRNAAGLAVKNTLAARETPRQEMYSARWRQMDEQSRNQIKENTMATLSSPERLARNVAAQVIAAIAAIELPYGAWDTLIAQLLAFGQRNDNPGLRQASLQTIGFVCESIKPEVLTARSNDILTAVVQGARKEETDVNVQLAAMHALYNSLEFVRENFDREGERNYIMQVVCEATQSQSADVQVASFECLVKIMQLYYDKMRFYMERALFALTVLGMNHKDERVALQGVEFWSTVCDEEIERQIEAEDVELEENPEREPQGFAKGALPQVLPVLLMLLAKQEEDAGDDEWNVSMAAGTCLALMAQCVQDLIVSPIIPYVEQHIKDADWHYREAAVMAFGSIMDGPNPKLLTPLVSQALPTLIEMMRDQNIHVKDTTAWTLGRISDVLVDTIKADVHLPNLVTALVGGLDDSPRIVSNCCWSLMNLAEQLGSAEADTGPMSQYYAGTVNALLQVAERSTNENNSRTSAYEALSTFATFAPKDCVPIVQNLLVVILERAERLLSMQGQLLGTDDRNNYNELHISFCGVLTSGIRRLGKEIEQLSNRIMTFLLQLISSAGKQSPIYEDAFLCVGAMTSTLELKFQPYLDAFLPFLSMALQSQEEYQLCSIGVGLVGDIARALGEASLPYAQPFMEALLADLQSPVLHRSVKPPILSCFGDIALAVGGGFEPFLDTTMNVLQQAGSMKADPLNYEIVDYVNSLREGILEAYTGIVGGLKSGGKSQLVQQYVPSMFEFLHSAISDVERTEPIIRGVAGLLGDISEAFPNGQIRDQLRREWVEESLKVARTRSMADPETKKVAKWAKEMVRRASR